MDSGGTSISEAVTSGDESILRRLLARGVDVNQANKGGQTPLILATVSGNVRLLRVLLDAGADPSIRDNTGLNAIDWAERKGLPDVAKLLHEANPTRSTGQQKDLSRHAEHSVQAPATSSPSPESSSKNTLSDDEKSRRWISGLKQRFDERAGRSAGFVGSVEAPEIGAANSQSKSTQRIVPQPVETESTNSAADSLSDLNDSLSSAESNLHSSARKKCPQCNATYNSDLVAYCAYHVVPLVDIDAPVPVTGEQESKRSLVLWLLVLITFFAATLIGLYLFVPRNNQTETVVGPSSTPTAVPMRKGFPLASTNLKTKILEMPTAETALRIDKPETVVVRIKIDDTGRVSSAQSQNGNEELRRAATDAARNAKFSADEQRGRETSGTIKYTFNP